MLCWHATQLSTPAGPVIQRVMVLLVHIFGQLLLSWQSSLQQKSGEGGTWRSDFDGHAWPAQPATASGAQPPERIP